MDWQLFEVTGDCASWMAPFASNFDDRIRELCAKALSTKEPDELTAVLSELQSAMHERIAALRKQAATALGSQRDSKGKRDKN